MVISTIEESELPENYGVITLYHMRNPADAVGQVILSASGQHPKCKLIRAHVVTLAYSTAPDVIAIERGSGEDVATATSSATVGTPVAFTIAPAAGTTAVFERNEDIAINLTTDGNALNADLILLTLVTVH